MPDSAGALEWTHHDVDTAIEQAATCDGHVLVDVYATWCGPCQRLVREVFPDARVERAARDMIAVKVDAEAPGGPELVERFHVVGYPTVLVLDSHGRELGRVFGFAPAEQFARRIEAIRFGPRSFGELWRRFVERGRAETVVQTAFDVGFDAASCGDYETADRLLRGVALADPDDRAGLAARALLVLGKYRYLRGAREYDAAIAVFDELRERYPESEAADEALVQTAIAHARAGRTEPARAAFEAYVALGPDDPERLNGAAFSMVRERVDIGRAVELARRGVELAPGDASIWDTLAEAEFADGDAAAALRSIERAIELAPDNPYYAQQRTRFAR